MAKKKPIPHQILINGTAHHAYFEYETYGELREKHGENPDYLNPRILTDYILGGLKSKNPEMTLEIIQKARPPLIPAILDIKDAIQDLYYGEIDPNEEEEEGRKPKALAQ